MPGPTWIAATVSRYRDLDIEYAALKVVGRGLFLAVTLMVVFLFVFARVTDQIIGINEVLLPTVSVDPSVDLGALVRNSFARTSGAVLSIVGVITLVGSAILTSSALRQGTHRALLGAAGPRPRLRQWGTLLIAVTVPLIVLSCWLLTLGTSIRRTAWSQLLGVDLADVPVDLAKVAAVLLQWLIVAGTVALVVRRVSDRWPGLGGTGICAVIGGVVTAANYFLLSTYVGALINPEVSAGIVLVLTVLLWVNIVVRVYLGALCLLAVVGPIPAIVLSDG